jgi:hypothetical protein
MLVEHLLEVLEGLEVVVVEAVVGAELPGIPIILLVRVFLHIMITIEAVEEVAEQALLQEPEEPEILLVAAELVLQEEQVVLVAEALLWWQVPEDLEVILEQPEPLEDQIPIIH